MIYIPEFWAGFIVATIIIFALAGIFNALTESEEEYNLDQRIQILKKKLKKRFNIKSRNKKAKKKQEKGKKTAPKKLTKKEAQEKLKNLFKE